MKINNFETALQYLGKNGCKITKENEKIPVLPELADAVIAINKLMTIAKAWNKEDNFVPDFLNEHQSKWYPVFKVTHAGFDCVSAYRAFSYAGANDGARLCFKSEERAKEFGMQFIDLWEAYLMG
ncbi:MAG: hypothetical protein PHC31_13045 [Clostridia bacterium]|nr:hypothetical protein [Clostridia bacterium]